MRRCVSDISGTTIIVAVDWQIQDLIFPLLRQITLHVIENEQNLGRRTVGHQMEDERQ
jgi:hypothetical protein